MNIVLNGQKKTIDPAPSKPPNIETLIQSEGFGDMLVAVARNGHFVPRGAYANTNLEDGDEIEVVAPMQGG